MYLLCEFLPTLLVDAFCIEVHGLVIAFCTFMPLLNKFTLSWDDTNTIKIVTKRMTHKYKVLCSSLKDMISLWHVANLEVERQVVHLATTYGVRSGAWNCEP